VQNRVRVVRQQFMRAENGERSDFTPDNFAKLIADDPQLQRSLADLSAKEAQDKLFKMLLIYNDRHPFHLLSK
jgi:hypothetical protein